VSRPALRGVLIAMTLAGLGIAGYLTYVHYAGIKPICSAGGSCEKVQTSVYSELLGVPVALMGLLTYIALLGLLLAPDSEQTRFAAMALTFVGFAFSAYLTYRELYSIHAICEWCASSAVILTAMTPLSIWRFLRGAPIPAAAGVSPQTQQHSGRESIPPAA
jgi:uncharacterized membrane protein